MHMRFSNSSRWKRLEILNPKPFNESMDQFVMEVRPAEGEELAQTLKRNAARH